MGAVLLEGKPVAEKMRQLIQAEVASLSSKFKTKPSLVAFQIGENTSSEVYLRNQKRAAELVGIKYDLKKFPDNISQADAEASVRALNSDKSVTAIIVQLPVPRGIDVKRLVGLIDPIKDAEGVHAQNIGKILFGDYKIGPCTAMAVMELLASASVNIYGKEACIVGHSDIVGKPLALMLLNKFATTTVCHIATGERGVLSDHVKRAELLIVAVGKPGIIKGEWIKEGAIVVDVGINRVGDKLVGDVEFNVASQRASYITPVPGGVGPLTTVILMRNVIELFKQQHA